MERIKYPELKGKCKTCIGCNQLELKSFTGKYECKDYVKGVINGIRRSYKDIRKF